MARGARTFKVTLELSDSDRCCYESLPLTVALHPSEQAERMLARLIAYGLCFEEGLSFGRGISSQDEATLWRHDEGGVLQHWIEVGVPDAERLTRFSRRAPRLTLFAYGSSTPVWWKQHESVLSKLEGLTVLVLDHRVLSRLAQELSNRFSLGVVRSGGQLYLDIDGKVQDEMALSVLCGEG